MTAPVIQENGHTIFPIRGGGLILKLYSPQDSKAQLSANRCGEVNFFDNQENKKDSRPL